MRKKQYYGLKKATLAVNEVARHNDGVYCQVYYDLLADHVLTVISIKGKPSNKILKSPAIVPVGSYDEGITEEELKSDILAIDPRLE